MANNRTNPILQLSSHLSILPSSIPPILLSSYLLIILFALSLSSCQKEKECEEMAPVIIECGPVSLGHFEPKESSRQISSFQDVDSRIYVDSLGNEAVFKIADDDAPINLNSIIYTSKRCLADTTKIQEYRGRSNTIHKKMEEVTNFTNLSFKMNLFVTARYLGTTLYIFDLGNVFPRKGENEIAYLGQSFVCDDQKLPYVLGYPEPVSSVQIFDKYYADVTISSQNTLFLNREFGLFAFKDLTGKTWVLKE